MIDENSKENADSYKIRELCFEIELDEIRIYPCSMICKRSKNMNHVLFNKIYIWRDGNSARIKSSSSSNRQANIIGK